MADALSTTNRLAALLSSPLAQCLMRQVFTALGL